MKHLLITIAVLSSSLAVSSEGLRPNINLGDFIVGGSVDYIRVDYGAAPETTIDITAPVQYFVVDRLAVGGEIAWRHFTTGTFAFNLLSIGPALSYFFWVQDRLTAFTGTTIKISYDFTGRQSSWSLSGMAGLQYFVTPSVALGPILRFTHGFASGGGAASNQVMLQGNFSVYL